MFEPAPPHEPISEDENIEILEERRCEEDRRETEDPTEEFLRRRSVKINDAVRKNDENTNTTPMHLEMIMETTVETNGIPFRGFVTPNREERKQASKHRTCRDSTERMGLSARFASS